MRSSELLEFDMGVKNKDVRLHALYTCAAVLGH